MTPIVAASRIPSGKAALEWCSQCLRPLAHSKFITDPKLIARFASKPEELHKQKQSVKTSLNLSSFSPAAVLTHPLNPTLKFCGAECFSAFENAESAPSLELQQKLDEAGLSSAH